MSAPIAATTMARLTILTFHPINIKAFVGCGACGYVGEGEHFPAFRARSGGGKRSRSAKPIVHISTDLPGKFAAACDSRGYGAGAPHCTKRRDNAHKIEELEVLYPWHPWFGRVVHVHEVIEQRAGGVLHCSPDGDASRRWLELPQWMFDRAACLAIRMAASPRVDTTALIALKTCLADASDAGLCGGPLSNASASGAGRNSCDQNQGAARATQVPTSTQPSDRRQAVRSIRSTRREAPDPGVRVAAAAGGDPPDGHRADGAPTRQPPTPRSRAQLDRKAR